MITISKKDQIELYDMLNARHTVTKNKVDDLTFAEIIEIATFLRNNDYV